VDRGELCKTAHQREREGDPERAKNWRSPIAKYLLIAPAVEVAMSDESWEEQFKQFLRKTGDDFRRAGADTWTAQRLDPQTSGIISGDGHDGFPGEVLTSGLDKLLSPPSPVVPLTIAR